METKHVCLSIGSNAFGQQCNRTTEAFRSLQKMTGLPKNIYLSKLEISKGGSTIILLSSNYECIVFGNNDKGQLGIGNRQIKFLINKWSGNQYIISMDGISQNNSVSYTWQTKPHHHGSEYHISIKIISKYIRLHALGNVAISSVIKVQSIAVDQVTMFSIYLHVFP